MDAIALLYRNAQAISDATDGCLTYDQVINIIDRTDRSDKDIQLVQIKDNTWGFFDKENLITDLPILIKV